MLTNETLFIHALDELEQRLKRGTEYDTVRAAGLIRLLLIDGEALIHAVNRERRRQVRFRITRIDVSGADDIQSAYSRLFSDDIPVRCQRRKIVDLRGLLRQQFIWSGGTGYTVRDVVTFLANSHGGIHAVVPPERLRDGKRQLYDEFACLMGSEDGFNLVVESMAGVMKVVVSGLSPLRNQIARDLKKRGGTGRKPVPPSSTPRAVN